MEKKPIAIISIVAVVIVIILAGFILTADSGSDKDKEHENGDDDKKTTKIIEDITTVEAYNMINKNISNKDFVILDVRTPEEFADGHLNNSENLDYYSNTFEDDLDKLDKELTYLVYCRTGSRSANAVDIMEDLNFTTVYNMLGGIVEWQNLGYELVK